MENQEPDEPMQKKPHLLESVSPTAMARNSSPSHPIAKSVSFFPAENSCLSFYIWSSKKKKKKNELEISREFIVAVSG